MEGPVRKKRRLDTVARPPCRLSGLFANGLFVICDHLPQRDVVVLAQCHSNLRRLLSFRLDGTLVPYLSHRSLLRTGWPQTRDRLDAATLRFGRLRHFSNTCSQFSQMAFQQLLSANRHTLVHLDLVVSFVFDDLCLSKLLDCEALASLDLRFFFAPVTVSKPAAQLVDHSGGRDEGGRDQGDAKGLSNLQSCRLSVDRDLLPRTGAMHTLQAICRSAPALRVLKVEGLLMSDIVRITPPSVRHLELSGPTSSLVLDDEIHSNIGQLDHVELLNMDQPVLITAPELRSLRVSYCVPLLGLTAVCPKVRHFVVDHGFDDGAAGEERLLLLLDLWPDLQSLALLTCASDRVLAALALPSKGPGLRELILPNRDDVFESPSVQHLQDQRPLLRVLRNGPRQPLAL